MTYKLIEMGPARGQPALHLWRGEAWDLDHLGKVFPDLEEEFGMKGAKKVAFFDGALPLRAGWKDDDDVEKLLKLLRDFGFFLIGVHLGSEYPKWARSLNVDLTMVEPNEKWLQFATHAIIFDGVPNEVPKLPEHLWNSAKFLRLGTKANLGQVAKFVKEFPFPVAVQIGIVGGMEVEL